MTHIFISYKHSDGREFVEKNLVPKLEGSGIKVWWDQHIEAGNNWSDEIDQALRDTLVVIAVVTPEAMTSQYCIYEWSFAIGQGKLVIPVIRKKTTLHPCLAKWQALDFTDGYDAPWDKLIARIKNYLPKLPVAEETTDPKQDALLTAISELISYDSLERQYLNTFLVYNVITPHDIKIINDIIERSRHVHDGDDDED